MRKKRNRERVREKGAGSIGRVERAEKRAKSKQGRKRRRNGHG